MDGRGIEDEFLSIAKEIPEFGGFYVDSMEDLVAYVTDTAASSRTVAAVDELLSRGPARFAKRNGSVPKIRVISGSYSFAALVAWKDRLHELISGVPGGVFLDADEMRNRVRIGVRDSTAAADIAWLRSAPVSRGLL